ncbi:MAG: gamma-glutamyltransferase, partial [Longimicrobiales bacterium]
LNPDLGAALRHIALHGADAFYRGPLTAGIVETMNAGGHPVTAADFAAYEPVWRRPLCIAYEGRNVLSAPPPQTGAQVLHTLQLLEPYDFARLGLPTRDARAFDALTSALRVGMADNRGVNDDPRWDDVPASGRVAPAFAAQRASLVGTASAPDSIATASAAAYDDAPPEPGCAAFEPYGPAPTAAQPADAQDDAVHDGDAQSIGADPDPAVGHASHLPPHAEPTGTADERGETTHISVVDGDGNAVSLTQTNSTVFGSGAWVHGFFLNDSGYIFREEADLQADLDDAPNWRTRTTTIAPTLVLASDDVELVIGAPGGGRIPTEIVQTMVYLLDYGMDPLEAVRMPRIYPSSQSARVQLEHGFAAALLHDVREMGYDPVPPTPGYARLYLVARHNGQWIAVADPRHDGEARAY